MTRGELGLQTPRSFHNKAKGFFDLEVDRVEKMRYQTALLMNATGNYSKGVKIMEIWPIPEIDKTIKIKPDKKEVQKTVDKYATIFKDK